MSKILDLLNYNKKRGLDKRNGGDDLSPIIGPENFDSQTKEKLANTYIFNPANASDHVIAKQEKAVEHKYHPRPPKSGFRQLFPWIISFLAVLLLLVNIAYRGKINVNIEFVGEGAEHLAPAVPKTAPIKKDLIASEGADIIPMPSSLIANGRFNKAIVKSFGFYGAAISRSRVLEDGLYLFNDGATGWASAGLDLATPMDLSNTTLDFFIKGSGGNESLELTLRDAESNSYMPQAHNIVFNKNMGADWQFVSVPFSGFNGVYNPKNIKHIGFEFGTQTTSNEPGDSIQIKNIKIVKSTATP